MQYQQDIIPFGFSPEAVMNVILIRHFEKMNARLSIVGCKRHATLQTKSGVPVFRWYYLKPLKFLARPPPPKACPGRGEAELADEEPWWIDAGVRDRSRRSAVAADA